MVLTSGCGPRGQEFRERRRQAQVAYACNHQAPNDGARTATREGQRDRRRQRCPGVEDGEGQTEHGYHRKVPLELLLMAEVF